MRVFNNIPERGFFHNPVVTMGNFDGVHIGHRKILSVLMNIAEKISGDDIVITFSAHPRKLINPDEKISIITTVEEKIKVFDELGINNVILLDFSREIADLNAQDFFYKYLIDMIGAKELVIGYDHTFGKNREGNLNFLMKISSETGTGITKVDEERSNGRAISSTWLREEIRSGNIKIVPELLGRKYTLKGTVVHGTGRGRTIGFPTANIVPDDPDKIIPADGVYAISLILGNNLCKNGMVNIGFNPTFSEKRRTIEANIFDFGSDIYNDKIEIVFFERIRDEKKFNSPDELAEQLAQDKIAALNILKKDEKK